MPDSSRSTYGTDPTTGGLVEIVNGLPPLEDLTPAEPENFQPVHEGDPPRPIYWRDLPERLNPDPADFDYTGVSGGEWDIDPPEVPGRGSVRPQLHSHAQLAFALPPSRDGWREDTPALPTRAALAGTVRHPAGAPLGAALFVIPSGPAAPASPSLDVTFSVDLTMPLIEVPGEVPTHPPTRKGVLHLLRESGKPDTLVTFTSGAVSDADEFVIRLAGTYVAEGF